MASMLHALSSTFTTCACGSKAKDCALNLMAEFVDKPESFLNEDGTFRYDPNIALAFGVGRRICPGRHLVDVTLFVVTASVLSLFHVAKAKDKDGNEIPVEVEMVVEGEITM
jgi:cytochrome P450